MPACVHRARCLQEVRGMRSFEDETKATKVCGRCGGRAFYWRTALVPGDPEAPLGSRRGESHYQPAWTCLACGYLEPHERRSHTTSTDEAAVLRRM
jgi:ribosomal protein L37E